MKALLALGVLGLVPGLGYSLEIGAGRRISFHGRGTAAADLPLAAHVRSGPFRIRCCMPPSSPASAFKWPRRHCRSRPSCWAMRRFRLSSGPWSLAPQRCHGHWPRDVQVFMIANAAEARVWYHGPIASAQASTARSDHVGELLTQERLVVRDSRCAQGTPPPERYRYAATTAIARPAPASVSRT